MKKPTESKIFVEFKKKISNRSDFQQWQYKFKDSASLTLPAKSSDVGDLIMFDDHDQLTLVVGQIYHTHFNPAYGPSFDKASTTEEKHIANEAMEFVNSILNDQKRMIPCSVLLEGEYGQSDICIGVPCIIGKNGIEEIVDIKLNDAEKAVFEKSAAAVRNMNADLNSVLA